MKRSFRTFRKKPLGGYAYRQVKTGRRKKYKATFRKGYNRTSGYYGRYTGINAEHKFLDTSTTDATVTSAMKKFNLCVIEEGPGESKRIGRKVRVKNIHYKGTLTIPSQSDTFAFSSAHCVVRLVQDKQTNGAEFGATDLLETDSFLSFNNLANSKRFRVLFTKYVTLVSPSVAATSATVFNTSEDSTWVNFNIPCNIELEYDNTATTGAISTMRSNSLWITFSTSDNELLAIGGTVRIRYSDR